MNIDFEAAVDAPFRMQPGLRRLAPGARQLTPSTAGGAHLRAKLQVLGERHHEALCVQPGFDALPALQALAAQARHEWPQALQGDPAGRIDAPLLGWGVQGEQVIDLGTGQRQTGQTPAGRSQSGLGGTGHRQTGNVQADGHTSHGHADPRHTGEVLRSLPVSWRAAALLSLAFQEDFAVVDGRTATVPWLAVALPSHWAPIDKVGRHFAEIHAPVADNALLLSAGEALMRMVTATQRWERFVWNVSRHASLQAHPAHVDPAPWPEGLTPDALAARAWWRSERQTFIPLSPLQQAVFTIRVDVQSLPQAICSAERAARLHAAIASMSDAVLAYRSLKPVRGVLLQWLQSRAQPASANQDA
jgi:hypothetical protein